MKKIGAILVLCLLFSISILFNASAEMTATQKGAAGGAVVGAAAGGLLGGSRKTALIGAGVGALGGALLNDAKQTKEKEKGKEQ